MAREYQPGMDDGAIELGDDELESVTGGGAFGAFLALGSPGARAGTVPVPGSDPAGLPLRRRPGES